MATIAALQLQLGEISDEGIACVALADSLLKYNFDPNEPRDWHGRWTSEGAGGTPVPQSGPSGRRPRATPNDAAGASDPAPTSPQTITGSATYYNLVGRRMANGQMFDPGAMNAAMLKIPFGTVVTVTLAEDRSRSIKVTITDRGPYGPGRVIDLTEAAFKALVGSTRRGIVKVIVTVP